MENDYQGFFQNKGVLVFGGTGTIGSEIVNQILKFKPRVIRIFTNSENELWETKNRFKAYDETIRYLLGDIRNLERVSRAMDGMDYIFNAAAIKHVPISEYNPMEAIEVNILGLNNIIEAAFAKKVKKIIHISTDKAILPTTVMGATKMLGERLCITRNFSKGNQDIQISCVRFGNVFASRGSIIPVIKQQIDVSNEITLTGEKMQRFFISISEAVSLVLKAMVISKGGEVFVLKMPTVRIKDLIEVIIDEYAPKIGKDPATIQIKDVGPRAGEKFNEELVSEIEYERCYENGDLLVIHPSVDFGYNYPTEEQDKLGKPLNDTSSKWFSTRNAEPISKEALRQSLYQKGILPFIEP